MGLIQTRKNKGMNSFPTPQQLFFSSKGFGKRKSKFFSVNFTQYFTKIKFRVVFTGIFLPSRGVKKIHGCGKRIHQTNVIFEQIATEKIFVFFKGKIII
jgi:hypothetical protein